MSIKISEMCTETSIQDLPDEMLEHILLFVSLDDRRSALRVCRRWSTLKPFNWSSVQLVVDFAKNVGQEANYHRTLLASSRQYKHLVLYFGFDTSKYELLVEILQHFSHKMETLKLKPFCSFPIGQMLITQILSLCFNLRHLHIGSCVMVFDSHDLEILPMHKLEALYLEDNLLSCVPNMMNIAPNITRLHMQILNSKEPLRFVRHFSSQLVELEILFRWKLAIDCFSMMCDMQFPLLEKLNFSCDYFENHPGVSFDGFGTDDLFFRQLPLLKEVTLRCDFQNRIIHNLCQSCVNIHFLCVRKSYFSKNCFRAVCILKHLKHLRLEEATVDVPWDLYSRQTSLQKLTLYHTSIVHLHKFNIFVQRAFPNLAVMELLHLMSPITVDRSIALYGQICSNIPSLQRLVVSEPAANIMLGQFLEFCASRAPKELRFKCRQIFDISENETPKRIPLRKLVLDSPQTSPIVLKKLISSMVELRWLELSLEDSCFPKEISSLREQFPYCCIVTNPSITSKFLKAANQMLFPINDIECNRNFLRRNAVQYN